MQISNQDIMNAFWQQGANNCASIALIKAAIETFGLGNVFHLEIDGEDFIVTLKNGATVSFNKQNLQQSIRVGSFQPSKDVTPEKQYIYEEIREYAELCFAVMVAKYNIKYNLNNFDTALQRLSNGANARFVSQFLGLENHCSAVFRKGAGNKSLIAWQHTPWLKHVVYMSENKYDYYGKIMSNVSKFPKRIQFFDTERTPFSDAEKKHFLSENEESFSELNFINISKHGTFENTGDEQSFPQDVDHIIDHIKEKGIKKLLLHFHGGLVNENRGMDSAETFYKNFRTMESTLPVSIVWETGFLDALPETFRRIIKTDTLLRALIARGLKFFARRFNIDLSVLDNGFTEPSLEDIALVVETQTQNLTDDVLGHTFSKAYPENGFADLTDQVYAELQLITSDQELSQDDIERFVKEESAELYGFISPKLLWYSAKIITRCIVRFSKGRGHGVLPTIIEEACREIYIDDFGTEIWQVMKDQAKNMWRSNDKRSGDKQFAGRYLLDRIAENFTTDELKVDIVAHSAGSIVICELIRVIVSEQRYKDFKLNNVVFLAPACRCDLFSETLMRYPETYNNFRMFTMNDSFESKDKLIPVPVLEYLYTRSLLYLISGILEGRKAKDADAYILGLHRYIRKRKPYSSVAMLTDISDFLMLPDANSSLLILSKSDVAASVGRQTGAIQHGGFVQEPLTVESIKNFLK